MRTDATSLRSFQCLSRSSQARSFAASAVAMSCLPWALRRRLSANSGSKRTLAKDMSGRPTASCLPLLRHRQQRLSRRIEAASCRGVKPADRLHCRVVAKAEHMSLLTSRCSSPKFLAAASTVSSSDFSEAGEIPALSRNGGPSLEGASPVAWGRLRHERGPRVKGRFVR